MASLELRSDRFRIVFRIGGKKLYASLKTTDRKEAEGCMARLEENLRLVERGRLIPPPDADIPTFLLSDGKVAERFHLPEQEQALTLEAIVRRYVEVHSNGAMEENSLQTVEMHFRHFSDTLGAAFDINQLKQENLQAHIDRRAKKKGFHKRKLSPVTLRKEMASFRAMWNWGVKAGQLTGPFPNQGLVFPKTEEKPPFQTWDEIQRQLGRGGLSAADEKALWDSLFLTVPQIQEILDHVRGQELQPFVYPMFCFAAHTGARRSEMLRCRVTDVDFEGKRILIREKKRGRGHRTTRHVPLSPFLADVLRQWFANHPGGIEIFCQQLFISRSKAKRVNPSVATRNEVHDHFHRALHGSKWANLRGWHAFRHSFASNCAARGVDQRLIDAWMGHQTEEMRKRYRHLIPNQEQAAILSVFSAASMG